MNFDDILTKIGFKEKIQYVVLDDIDVEHVFDSTSVYLITSNKSVLPRGSVVENGKLTMIDRVSARKLNIRINDPIGNLENIVNSELMKLPFSQKCVFALNFKFFLKSVKDDDERISDIFDIFNSDLSVSDKIEQTEILL